MLLWHESNYVPFGRMINANIWSSYCSAMSGGLCNTKSHSGTCTYPIVDLITRSCAVFPCDEGHVQCSLEDNEGHVHSSPDSIAPRVHCSLRSVLLRDVCLCDVIINSLGPIADIYPSWCLHKLVGIYMGGLMLGVIH